MDDSQLVEINIVPFYKNGKNKDMQSGKVQVAKMFATQA